MNSNRKCSSGDGKGSAVPRLCFSRGWLWGAPKIRNLWPLWRDSAGGGYDSGGLCGAFTGACCLLGLHAGKGSPEGEKDPRLPLMIYALRQWFCENFGPSEKGITCGEILATLPGSPPLACSSLVMETLLKTLEILEEQGFDLQESPYTP